MTHKLASIFSDNGLSPGRHQAIIWTNTGIVFIWPLGTKCSEILIDIHIFSFKMMYFNITSTKFWVLCLGLDVLSFLVVLDIFSQCVFSCRRPVTSSLVKDTRNHAGEARPTLQRVSIIKRVWGIYSYLSENTKRSPWFTTQFNTPTVSPT